MNIETQFETNTIDLIKPLRLCAPADKNGETQGAAQHPESLLCYRVKSGAGIGTISVSLNNQFGPQDYLLKQRREFCVPSTTNRPYGSPSRAFLAKPSDLLE